MLENDHDCEEEHGDFNFSPVKGDVLLELKGENAVKHGQTFIWRMIVSDHRVKRVWPKDIEDSSCPHEDILWAIDSNLRLISLCEECGEFEWGQKVED